MSKSAAQVIFYSLLNNFLDINDFFHEIPLTAKAHNGNEVEGSSCLKFSVHVLRAYLLLTKVLGIVGIYIQTSKMADERFEPGENNANCNHNMVVIPLKMHQEISFYR